MSRVIHKQLIPIGVDTHVIPIEKGYKFISVQRQYADVAIWYECSPNAPHINVEIHLVKTGEELPDGALKYLGTVQIGLNILYVVHVYEGRII